MLQIHVDINRCSGTGVKWVVDSVSLRVAFVFDTIMNIIIMFWLVMGYHVQC